MGNQSPRPAPKIDSTKTPPPQHAEPGEDRDEAIIEGPGEERRITPVERRFPLRFQLSYLCFGVLRRARAPTDCR